MIHERKISKTLQVEGPLSTCIASLEATLNEIHASITIQNEGFQNLVAGSDVTMDEVLISSVVARGRIAAPTALSKPRFTYSRNDADLKFAI